MDAEIERITKKALGKMRPGLSQDDALKEAMRISMEELAEAVKDGTITNEQLEEYQKTLPQPQAEEVPLEEKMPPCNPEWAKRITGLLRLLTPRSVASVELDYKTQYLYYTSPWKMAVKQVRSKLPPDYDITNTKGLPKYSEVKKAIKNIKEGHVLCVIEIPITIEISSTEIFYIIKE